MKHIAGAILLLIACLFYCCPYICSAIYLSKFTTDYSNEVFKQGIEWVGGNFQILSIIFFIAGIFYLIWAEKKEKKNINQK